MSDGTKRKRGRPKSGKVLYAQRVSPEMAEKFEEMRRGVRGGVVVPVEDGGEVGRLRVELAEMRAALEAAKDVGPEQAKPDPNVGLLLGDVERLEAQVEELKERLERCAAATEKARFWMQRALAAEAALKGRSDYDQT